MSKARAAKPDAIIAIGNDHLDNFFFDNQPAFAIASGPEVEGPFWYEAEVMHLPAYRARVQRELAEDLRRTRAGLPVAFFAGTTRYPEKTPREFSSTEGGGHPGSSESAPRRMRPLAIGLVALAALAEQEGDEPRRARCYESAARVP